MGWEENSCFDELHDAHEKDKKIEGPIPSEYDLSLKNEKGGIRSTPKAE